LLPLQLVGPLLELRGQTLGLTEQFLGTGVGEDRVDRYTNGIAVLIEE